MTALTPVITTAYDADTGLWHLEATSYGRTSPAGPRLFRAAPHPDIAFAHEDKAAAEADALKLTRYLEGLTARKGPSKAALRKQGAT